MKIHETLTPSQKTDLLLGEVVGIFETMFVQSDEYYKERQNICLGYYTYHSADKTLSPTYDRFLQYVAESHDIDRTAEQLIGSLIRAKFADKWSRVYKALVAEYDPISNREFTSKKTATNQNKDTYDTVKAKEGNDTDTLTYNTNVEDDGNSGTHEVTNRSVSSADDVYGFNSVTPVGDTTSAENTNETFEADPTKNVTHNLQKKTGTETKEYGTNESETHTGTETTDITIDETTTNSGRDGSSATLIDEEIEFRNKQQFYDIVYKDIDSITALQIYI